MSTTSTSISPQWTSVRNCSSARWSIGPRHITGSLLVEEEADRHELQVVLHRRHDQLVHGDRPLPDAENVRDRVAVDVGVEHADAVAELRERDREVRGQRRLADAALAARDREHAAVGAAGGSRRPARARRRGASASAPGAPRASSRRRRARRPVTPGTSASACSTCCSNESRSGQPAMVRTIVSATTPSWISRSRTMSSSVTGRRSSGSITCSSACRTSSRSGVTRASVARACPAGAQQPTAKRSAMTSESTTRWPLLDERGPFPQATRSSTRRKLPRSAWLLTGLAFICGGLVSAAGFSIGWRHQAQRDTAARDGARGGHRADAHARAAGTGAAGLTRRRARRDNARALRRRPPRRRSGISSALPQRSATRRPRRAAPPPRSPPEHGSLTGSATRIASELKTLETYLTTTPAGQLDPGYIASQTAYLSQQLTRLQAAGGESRRLGRRRSRRRSAS